jgi:hypothetical protein
MTAGDLSVDTSTQRRRAIPLGWLLQGMMLVALVCAVLVAFLPVYTASKRASSIVIDELRRETRDRIRLAVVSFFRAPMDQVSMLSGQSRFLSADWAPATFTHLQPFIRAMALSAFATGRSTYAGLMYQNASTFYQASVDDATVDSLFMTVNGRTIETFLTPPVFSNASVVTNDLNTGTYDPTTRGWYQLLRERQAWTGVYMDWNLFPVATCGAPLYLAGSDTILGALAIDYPSDSISQYMRTLTIGRTGRAVLLDAATQSVWGANFDFPQTMNETDGGLRLTEYRDVSDATLVKVRDELGAAWPFLAGERSAVVANRAMSRGAVYVDVVPITDAYGLDMRLLTAMPEADFAAPFWDGAVLSVAVTCGVAVVLIAVLVLVLRYISSGLARVVARLHAAAYLDVGGTHGSASSELDHDEDVSGAEDEDETPNMIARHVGEMVRIEEAFAVLRGELAHIKGFLPAHILAAAAAAKRGDVEEEDAATASDRARGGAPLGGSGAALRSSQQPATGRSASSRFSFHSASSSGPARTATLGMPTAGPAQQGSEGLRTRRVTVAVANTWRFCETLTRSLSGGADHDLAHSGAAAASSRTAHAAVLRRIEHAARRTGGSVDSFVGDAVYVSWNAATACATHRSAGAEFACRVAGDSPQSALGQPQARLISVGVASSVASLGVVGSHRVKRFAIIGPCVGQAAQLERLCRAFSAPLSAVSPTPRTLHNSTSVLALSTSSHGATPDCATRPLVLNLVSGSVFEASQHDVAAAPLDVLRITAGSATQHAGAAQATGIHLSVVATALPLILQDFEVDADIGFDQATENASTISGVRRKPSRRGKPRRTDEEWMYTVDGVAGGGTDPTNSGGSGGGAVVCEDCGLPPHYALALRHTGLAFFALAAAAADATQRKEEGAASAPTAPAVSNASIGGAAGSTVVARARTHLNSATGLAKRAVQLPTGPAADAIRHAGAALEAALARLELLVTGAEADAEWVCLLDVKARDPAVVFAP